MFLCLKARHEAAMRRTVDRSQRAKQKPNRWSWGGSLQPSTPSTAAGTLTSRVHWCFLLSEMKRYLCSSIVVLNDPLAFLVTADPCSASPSLSPVYLFALGSPLCSASPPLSFALVVQALLSRLSSIHSTLLDWSTCTVLSVSTADTE